MQCREFREISEAYLSDELLVETNIQVFRHLENCFKCREDFAAKRNLRQRMREAVKGADEFQINPVFARRLTENLRQTALHESFWRKLIFVPKFLIPVMASLVLVALLGFLTISLMKKTDNFTVSSESFTKGLTQISLLAVGNHKDCALEKMQMWEQMSKHDYAEKVVYTEKIAKPLQAKFDGNIEMMHAHDCLYQGKQFTHVILRKDSQIVSVFVDKTDILPNTDDSTTAKIICEKENGLQVASFQKNNRAIFVISDMSETENLSIARTLSDTFSA